MVCVRVWSTRNGIFGCRDKAAEFAVRDTKRPRRPKGTGTDSGNPGTNGLSGPNSKLPGSGGLDGGAGMDRTANPPPSRRTGLRHPSQERKFSMQRREAELGSFAVNARPETARIREFGGHVFEIAVLSRASLNRYNLRVWVVGATGIEPVTPSMSTRCSPAELRALDLKMTGWVRISAPKRAGKDAGPEGLPENLPGFCRNPARS
jgi:hypothetical protein